MTYPDERPYLTKLGMVPSTALYCPGAYVRRYTTIASGVKLDLDHFDWGDSGSGVDVYVNNNRVLKLPAIRIDDERYMSVFVADLINNAPRLAAIVKEPEPAPTPTAPPKRWWDIFN